MKLELELKLHRLWPDVICRSIHGIELGVVPNIETHRVAVMDRRGPLSRASIATGT